VRFTSDSNVEDQDVEINLTSLVDVVFLLLIFFMVSTTFNDTQGINVKLPTASTNPPQTETQKDIAISIDATSNVFLGSNKVALSQLLAELRTVQNKGAVQTVILRADKSVNHGTVVEVMDTIREAGIGKIAVATTTK